MQETIALTLIPNVGDVLAKQLVTYFGNADEVLCMTKSKLEKVPGIGKTLAVNVIQNRKEAMLRAEKELNFIEKKGIEVLVFNEEK